MSFGAPIWFWALGLLPLFAILFFRNERRGRHLLAKLVALRLQPQLAGDLGIARRRIRFFLFLGAIALGFVSLAKPRLGYTFEESKRQGRDLIIAVDSSKSMLATDLAPNRLTRAKLAALDLIGLLPGDRLGLVAFAGSAFLQAPLTIDYGAVRDSLNEVDTEIIPHGGTNISAAIREAEKAFGKGESESRALILFTDGEELDADAVKVAREVAANFKIFTVGVGSTEGSIIPVPGGDGGTSFVKDPQGNFVKSRLDEARLSEIAEAAGGFYLRLENGPPDMRQIVERGLGQMTEHEIDARQARKPIERYQWPLSAAILLLVAGLLTRERKRRPVAAVLTALFLAHSQCFASDGVTLYGQQKYKEARENFQAALNRKPDSDKLQFNLGTAAYQLGDYDGALAAFGKALATKDPELRKHSQYNLANTLAQRGAKQTAKEAKLKDWQDALGHYEEFLKAAPNEQAQQGRDLVKKLIEDLKKEEPKDQQQKDQQQKDQQQGQSGQSGQQPQPQTPPEPPSSPKDFSGDIKAQGDPGKEPSSEEAMQAVPVEPGKMNEPQARALLESLRQEEASVSLNERKGSAPVLRDW